MNRLKIYISVCIMSTIMSSCKEIPVKIADPVIPDTEKIVLIEEITGASCPNCPKGSAAIQNIVNRFPGKVAAIAIHGDFLAQPTDKSKYDFRNQKAKDLENWFKPWFGKPSASVNRVSDVTGALMIDVPDLWQAAVETELQKINKMNLLLETSFDSTSRKLQVDIAAIPLIDLPGSFNISVYITESQIQDAQSNGSVIEENFIHKHVLSDMLSRFDGDILGENLMKNNILNRTYTYTLPTSPTGIWKPENMEVVVMVSYSQVNNKSVVQAAVKPLVK